MPNLEAFLNHPIETLEKALHIRKQIDQLNEMLKELFGPSPVSLGGVQTNAPRKRGRPRKVTAIVDTRSEGETGPVAGGPKKKRKMSAAAKAKIAAAQRTRWAKAKSSHGPLTAVVLEPSKVPRKKKRGMSAEGRARIAAAQKARREREKKRK